MSTWLRKGGRFSLADRGDLWRLLLTITSRKAVAAARRERSQKRGGGALGGESVFLGANDGPAAGIGDVAGAALTPEMEAMIAENCRRLLDLLPDELLRRIAVMRLEGYTSDEIAEKNRHRDTDGHAEAGPHSQGVGG